MILGSWTLALGMAYVTYTHVWAKQPSSDPLSGGPDRLPPVKLPETSASMPVSSSPESTIPEGLEMPKLRRQTAVINGADSSKPESDSSCCSSSDGPVQEPVKKPVQAKSWFGLFGADSSSSEDKKTAAPR